MKNKEIQFEALWNDKKKGEIKQLISSLSAEQSKEQILANNLLSIQYQLEDYIQNENEEESVIKILDFVKMYLKVLKLSKRSLAVYFEMKDSNLHKYLSGERKLNAEVVMKLSAFFHTKPEYWYHIQVKNELIELKKEKEKIENYKKYDYRKFVDL